MSMAGIGVSETGEAMLNQTWVIPPELTRRPRRVVWRRQADYLSRLGLWLALVIVLTLMLVPLQILVMRVGWLVARQPLAVNAEAMTYRSGKGGSRIELRYRLPTRASAVGFVEITEDDAASLTAAGVPVVGKYWSIADRRSPEPTPSAAVPATLATYSLGPFETIRFASESSASQVRGSLLIPAWFVLIGLGVSSYLCLNHGWPTQRPRSTRQLYRRGSAAQGRVESKAVRKNRPTIHYAFHLPDGTRREASHEVSLLNYDKVQVGQSVTVLHFEGKSKPSVVYEFGGFKCV